MREKQYTIITQQEYYRETLSSFSEFVFCFYLQIKIVQ